MAIRFRKSIKLAPGVRMNLGRTGLSWTVGPRGTSVGIGKRGTFLNVGLPGTGLSVRQAVSGGSGQSGAKATPADQEHRHKVALTVAVHEDGSVTFMREDGSAVPDSLIADAKRQQGDAIMALIQSKCDEINDHVRALGELHLDVPDPSQKPQYAPAPFPSEAPIPPTPKVPGFFDSMLKSRWLKIEQENNEAQARHKVLADEWAEQKRLFELEEARKVRLVDKAVSGDVEAMEEFFGTVLSDIAWPRETAVSFEVQDGGRALAFDVDLPEIEYMPTKTASVPQRGFRLTVKELSSTAVQKLYAQHVHSIAFRLIGEAFGMLPTLSQVTLSGYTQRPDKATGHTVDQYLLSVVVKRADWEQLSFSSLSDIDVIEALGRFELRREMSKTGVFKPIEPL